MNEFEKLFLNSANFPTYNAECYSVEEAIVVGVCSLPIKASRVYVNNSTFMNLKQGLGSRVSLDALAIDMAVFPFTLDAYVIKIVPEKTVSSATAYVEVDGYIKLKIILPF